MGFTLCRWLARHATIVEKKPGSGDLRLSIQRRDIRIRNLAPFFKGVTLRNITAKHCEAWVTSRGSKIAPQTFVHELEVMRAVFRYALKHGLILSNPAEDIQRPKIVQAKIEIPTREQFSKLIADIRHSDGRSDSQKKTKAGADLVELLAYSGMRLGEATATRWQDVNFEANSLTVNGTKSSTSRRVIPITTALRDFLEKLKKEKPVSPDAAIVPIMSAKKCLQTACRRLGFPQFTHHDFRHFFATTCIESGVDIPIVSRWLVLSCIDSR